MGGFFSFVVVCAQVPFCSCPVYSRVLLFSFSCFGLFIKLLFIDKKKKNWGNKANAGRHSQLELFPQISGLLFFLAIISKA